MSVANLEAFALTQGIDKAFSEMTQGEQVMLRYQYLMQATADAQGDFARTSDGYANSLRTLQTNLDSLKTTIGEALLPIISTAVSDLNEMISAITGKTEGDTLFDQINAIDLDTDKKLAELEKVADEAQLLIDKLDLISQTSASEALSKLAIGANDLDSSAPETWEALLKSLSTVDGLTGIFGANGAAGNIEDLANALSGSEVDTTKAEAWQTFLGALSENADAVSKLTGEDVETTKEWLAGLSAEVEKIDPADVDAWDKLLTTLATGLASDTPEGRSFADALAYSFLAMGSDSEAAAQGLAALGYTTDQIADKQAEWLKSCQDLVRTIPGLSEVINTETGAVEGGLGTIQDYVDEWKASQEKIIRWKAYYARLEAQQEAANELYGKEMEAGGAHQRVKRIEQEIADAGGMDFVETLAKRAMQRDGIFGGEMTKGERWALDLYKEHKDAVKAAMDADDAYAEAVQQNAKITEENADIYAYLTETLGELTDEEKAAADGAGVLTSAWNSADTEGALEAINAVTKAVEELNTYYDNVWETTRKGIDSVADGFSAITTPAEKVRGEMVDLEKALADGKITAEEYEKELSGLDKAAIPSIQNMISGLEDQNKYWEDYLYYMELARSKGVSEDILAYLSDGSTENFDYLKALTEGGAGDIERINNLWAENKQLEDSAANQFTDTKLSVDETYQAMVDAAQRAADELDVYAEAANASEHTVQGIAEGIRAGTEDVAAAVEALNTELGKINPAAFKFLGPSFKIDGSHATGLDYVPFNGYLAQLHEGESVLTAEEARVWRDFKTAGASSANTIDYEAMGGVMRDNIKPGGNVYLDGNIVGRVVSDRQGNALRQLERSGWQR